MNKIDGHQYWILSRMFFDFKFNMMFLSDLYRWNCRCSHYRYTSSSICILFYLFSHTFCYGIHYLIPYFAVKRYIVKYRYILSFIQIKIILTTRLSLLNCFSFLNFKNNLPPKRLKTYCAHEMADRGDVCISCYSTSC